MFKNFVIGNYLEIKNWKLEIMSTYLLLSLILFTLGFRGVLRSASLLKIFMSVEVMLASINLFILSLAGDGAKSSVFIMFVWLISVAEISIVLALFILLYRKTKTMDINTLNKLKWWILDCWIILSVIANLSSSEVWQSRMLAKTR